MSRATVKRALGALQEAGLVDVSPRPGGRNLYRVLEDGKAAQNEPGAGAKMSREEGQDESGRGLKMSRAAKTHKVKLQDKGTKSKPLVLPPGSSSAAVIGSPSPLPAPRAGSGEPEGPGRRLAKKAEGDSSATVSSAGDGSAKDSSPDTWSRLVETGKERQRKAALAEAESRNGLYMAARKALLHHQADSTDDEGPDLVGKELGSVLERSRRHLGLHLGRAA